MRSQIFVINFLVIVCILSLILALSAPSLIRYADNNRIDRAIDTSQTTEETNG